ncbi:rhombosortase [Burkholderia sp. MR1-5-21]
MRLDVGWLAVCAAVMGLQCLPPAIAGLLVYDRAAISSGQVWRVATGHFVHLGWAHASLNAACLAACAWLAGRVAGGLRTIFALACGTGALLWFGVPQVARYAGLSGVVHGAAAHALIVVAGRRMPAWMAAGALVALAVRVGWQCLHGAPLAEAAWLGGPVAPAGHVAGSIAGVAWAGVTAYLLRRRDARSHGPSSTTGSK